MKIIFDSKEKTILVLKKGEEFFDIVNSFSKERNTSFTFSMIGGCSLVELAYYDMEAKKYASREFIDTDMEILTMTGNVAWYESEPLIHTHGIFSGRDYQSFGGHIMKLVISGTGELVINWIPEKLNREQDPDTCLKLLSDKK